MKRRIERSRARCERAGSKENQPSNSQVTKTAADKNGLDETIERKSQSL
jgi:hypothetical protein